MSKSGRRIAEAAGGLAVVAVAVTACGTSAPAVVHAPAPKPTVTKTVTETRTATATPVRAATTTEPPRPTVTATPTPTPTPAASTPPADTPAPAPSAATSSAAAGSDYLGDVFGGGTGNPCNFATGYQAGVCNPTGETEQQYIENPGGPAPGTSTNAQGCYYVRMGEGYCPSTGKTVPMQDPNG